MSENYATYPRRTRPFKRWVNKWLTFFKAWREIDFTADNWRSEVNMTWTFRHTMFCSPIVRKHILNQVNEHITDNSLYKLWKRDFRDYARERFIPKLSEAPKYAPYVDTGRLRASWGYYRGKPTRYTDPTIS